MVKIIGDTTSGLPASLVERSDIPILPQVINFGEVAYLEGVDIDHATFMRKLQTADDLLKTAAPPLERFAEAFECFAPSGEPIICALSSALVSGTDAPESPIHTMPPAIVTHGGPSVPGTDFFTTT